MIPEYLYMAEPILESALSASGVSFLTAVLGYVFSALSLYTIAQRRGISKAWLAWVPVINVWILGSISDQYRYVVKDEIRNKRKVLLGVNIAACIMKLVAVTVLIGSLTMTIYNFDPHRGAMEMIGHLLKGLLLFIPVWVLGIVGLVFEIMALYDVFTSCDTANNILYLVLSIIPGISPITKPLFLFLSRERDDGMPPRRETVENPCEY